MNTYGLYAVNMSTFNGTSSDTYPKPARNVVVTLFKFHNLTLNILGYIPGISAVSGCVRMGTGCILCVVTLLFGNRNAHQGLISKHFYDEALLTGITQIARGAFEALVPFGRVVNTSLDTICTFYNFSQGMVSGCCTGRAHSNPIYPFPFWLLDLA